MSMLYRSPNIPFNIYIIMYIYMIDMHMFYYPSISYSAFKPTVNLESSMYRSTVPEDHAYVNTELIKNPQKIWQSNIMSLEDHKSRNPGNLYSNTKSEMFT